MVSICPVCRAIFLESALLTQHYKVHSEELDKFDELTATPDPPDPVPSTSSQNSTYLIYDDEVTVEAERPQKKEKRKILVRYEIREIKE